MAETTGNVGFFTWDNKKPLFYRRFRAWNPGKSVSPERRLLLIKGVEIHPP